jgi:hypothetical protein
MTRDDIIKIAEEAKLLPTNIGPTAETRAKYALLEHFAALVAESIVRECIDNLAWHGHDEAARQLDWFLANKIRSER